MAVYLTVGGSTFAMTACIYSQSLLACTWLNVCCMRCMCINQPNVGKYEMYESMIHSVAAFSKE